MADGARSTGDHTRHWAEKPECDHCGDPADHTEPDHFKSPAGKFWHEDCFAEYCYECRSLVATPEGSFEIKPVIIKEIEDGKEEVIDSFWRAECPVCYRTIESEEKTEESRPDFVDKVTDCCDTEWLPPVDWIEDCEICGTDHRESGRCKPLSHRVPFPSPENHRYDCTECDWAGEGDEFGNPTGECPECGTTAVRAVKVATDGGVPDTHHTLLTDGGRPPTFAENEAAAAVRRAERRARSASSDTTGHFHGKCRDCGATFDFEYGDDQHMAPCPECGSNDWHREGDDE